MFINISLPFICPRKTLIPLYTDEVNVKLALCSILPEECLSSTDYYIESNGKLVGDNDVVENGRCYNVVLRVFGGKGGFGSMLRALGAQIEKTTNREACRDLSGRRMRDVNNEKRLREWVAKSSEREKAKAERRKERRERLTAVPRYKFDDPQYEQQKASVAESLDDALQEGLQRASSSGASASGASTSTASAALGARPRKRKALQRDSEDDSKKAKEWLGIDGCNIDSDDSSTASDKVIDPDESSSSSLDDTRDVECSSTAATCDTTCIDNTLDSDTSLHSPHSDLEPAASGDGEQAASVDGEPASVDGEPASVDGGPASVDGEPASCPSESPSSGRDQWIKDTPCSQDPGVKVTPKVESVSPSKQPASSAIVDEPKEPVAPLDLMSYDTVERLETLGLDLLKSALTARSLKCGGTLRQRAERLFAVRGLDPDQIDPTFFAKPNKKK